MDLGLRDRVAIVAASSRGLGKACALELAREGAKVVICARDATILDETAAEVRASGEKQAASLVEEARAEAARIVAEARKAAEGEAALAAQRAKDQLREQVATLAVAGAERILRREIDAQKHAELLAGLKAELR